MSLTIGSMFSGMGGLDLAVAQVLDAEPAWFCEWDDAPSKVLAHHWPHVPNHRDVTQIDWGQMPRVDILTGGYPCQPFSAAGRRKGTDDERHLWPYVRDAIRHLRPRFALLENVAGHRSLGLDTVLADLAEDGAHVWWTSLRASDGGAPHHRERLFILVAPDPSRTRPGELLEPFIAGVPPAAGGSRPDTPADADDQDAGRHSVAAGTKISGVGDYRGAFPKRGGQGAADAGGAAVGEHPGESPAEEAGASGRNRSGDPRGERPHGYRGQGAADPHGVGVEAGGQPLPGPPEVAGIDHGERPLPDTIRTGRIERRGAAPGQAAGGRAHGEPDRCGDGVHWGQYAPAVRRWERVVGPAPAPTELNRNGKPRLNPGFAEWMMGLPSGHVTAVPGVSRAEQLKAIGNGVCPQQGAAALTELLDLATRTGGVSTS